ncbi:hypothetical protein CEXT_238341 [Caerostris extrusa]|uniref:Uncharacterized protein n=1 Tax=Caerostris extrusa TaxID=172846 RepID=A0AAV4T1J8_CAEEX|nr:hypothetical protein CEXT_238341 [Caerostris extrusa]
MQVSRSSKNNHANLPACACTAIFIFLLLVSTSSCFVSLYPLWFGNGVTFDILLEYLVLIVTVWLIKPSSRVVIINYRLMTKLFFLSMIDSLFFNLPLPLIARTKQIKKPEIEHRTSSVSSLSYDHGSIPGVWEKREPPRPTP